MPELEQRRVKVRFEHGMIPELGLHRITSPDIKGFHIIGKTYEEAEREALAMLTLIQSRQASEGRGKLSSVEFAAA